jgi:hypothetical protein
LAGGPDTWERIGSAVLNVGIIRPPAWPGGRPAEGGRRALPPGCLPPTRLAMLTVMIMRPSINSVVRCLHLPRTKNAFVLRNVPDWSDDTR